MIMITGVVSVKNIDMVADKLGAERILEEHGLMFEALVMLSSARSIKQEFGNGPTYRKLKERGWEMVENALKVVREGSGA